MIDLKDDINLVTNVRKRAYVPYSHYAVGAVLTCKNGKKYTGCNIQNGGIQALCAERTAFCKAISEGEREFDYIVVVGGPANEKLIFTTPCGYCRQFMSEFVDKDFKIYNVYGNTVKEYTMEEILPFAFKL